MFLPQSLAHDQLLRFNFQNVQLARGLGWLSFKHTHVTTESFLSSGTLSTSAWKIACWRHREERQLSHGPVFFLSLLFGRRGTWVNAEEAKAGKAPARASGKSSAIRCARLPETNGNVQSEKQDDYPNRWTRDKWALQLIRDAVLEPNTSHIWRLGSRKRGRNGRFSVP